MKKYKLKKDFLYLKTGDTVEITRVKDLLAGLPRYIISENQWIIAEILDLTRFVFDDYFEEEKEEDENIFNLQEWDKYYSLNSNWYICLENYNSKFDKDVIENWNAFLTKREAEKELARRKAIFNIKKYCFKNNIEYKENVSDEDFYIWITYDSENEEFNQSVFTDHIDYWVLFFNSYEDLENIVKNCEEDLKIIFNF